MKFQLVLAVAAFFASTEAKYYHHKRCDGPLQELKHGECKCPFPLFDGLIKGDYNCYCGAQKFKSGVFEEILAYPAPKGSHYPYTCACYKDDHGNKTEWNYEKRRCEAVVEESSSSSSSSSTVTTKSSESTVTTESSSSSKSSQPKKHYGYYSKKH